MVRHLFRSILGTLINGHWHLYFSGRVQGVGFRYTAMTIARRQQVTGWVRNLTDGRVEAVVEGPPEVLQEFVSEIMESCCGNIANIDRSISSATGQYSKFEIRATC